MVPTSLPVQEGCVMNNTHSCKKVTPNSALDDLQPTLRKATESLPSIFITPCNPCNTGQIIFPLRAQRKRSLVTWLKLRVSGGQETGSTHSWVSKDGPGMPFAGALAVPYMTLVPQSRILHLTCCCFSNATFPLKWGQGRLDYHYPLPPFTLWEQDTWILCGHMATPLPKGEAFHVTHFWLWAEVRNETSCLCP